MFWDKQQYALSECCFSGAMQSGQGCSVIYRPTSATVFTGSVLGCCFYFSTPIHNFMLCAIGLDGVEFNAQPDTVLVISEVVFTVPCAMLSVTHRLAAVVCKPYILCVIITCASFLPLQIKLCLLH